MVIAYGHRLMCVHVTEARFGGITLTMEIVEEKAEPRGAGTTFKLGGGGKRLPGSKVAPIQN